MKKNKRRIALGHSDHRKRAKKAIVLTESVLTISTLQESSLARIKERVPENRAIQSLSSEEYKNYVKRLARTSKLLTLMKD